MFLVFNKEKIYAYFVSVATVVMLFFVADGMTVNNSNTVATSTSSNNEVHMNNLNANDNETANYEM